MEIMNLPDEMCASVMKYCEFETILQCRRMSNRLNNITITYDLNRVPVASIQDLGVLEREEWLLEKRNYVEALNMRLEAEARRRHAVTISGYTLEPLNDGVEYEIHRVGVFIKEEDSRSFCRQSFCTRMTEGLNIYEALDCIFKKMRCSNLEIGGSAFGKEIDECIRHNVKSFRNTRALHFLRDVSFKDSDNFRFLTMLSKLNYMSIDCSIQSHQETSVALKLLEGFNGGLSLRGPIKPRRPENLGDDILLRWMNKLPSECSIIDHRHNFTLPVFTNFLLVFVKRTDTKIVFEFDRNP